VELIRFGSIGPEVEDVQRRLEDLGYTCADAPGEFATGTLAAVRTFQQQRGLDSDGIVGDDTWRALVGASFRLGDRMLYLTRPMLHGDDVRDLQRRLSRLGFDAGYDDGMFGRQTFEAVREFQLNVGIVVDGIAGPRTVDLLSRLHRQHQLAPAYAVREREALRRPSRTSLAGARIMVDPAHGPDDPGLRAPDGTAEHEVTWQIGVLVQGRLAALGTNVLLSRGPLTTPTPSQRATHANREGVEAIVSIHTNGHASQQARGASGNFFGDAVHISERGAMLAELVVDRICEATGTPNCRTHPSTTGILRESRAPAITVAVGFLTHPEEGAALTQAEHQRAIADAIVSALVRYLVGHQLAVA
jgi:N-acetylmuramoyl-L-alanine amidase